MPLAQAPVAPIMKYVLVRPAKPASSERYRLRHVVRGEGSSPFWDDLVRQSGAPGTPSVQIVTSAEHFAAGNPVTTRLVGPYALLTTESWETIGRVYRVEGSDAAAQKLLELHLPSLFEPANAERTNAFRLSIWDDIAARLIAGVAGDELANLWVVLKLLNLVKYVRDNTAPFSSEVFNPQIVIPKELTKFIVLARRDKRANEREANDAALGETRGRANQQLKKALLARSTHALVRDSISLDETEVSDAGHAAPPAGGGGGPDHAAAHAAADAVPDAIAIGQITPVSIVLSARARGKFSAEMLEFLRSELGIEDLSREDAVKLEEKLQKLVSANTAALLHKASASAWTGLNSELSSIARDLTAGILHSADDAVSAYGGRLAVGSILGGLPGGPLLPPATIRPAGIADLKVVNQQLQKYQLGEVAYIENVLAFEERERTHTNLEKTEQQIITEVEETSSTERDLQTTERFELAQELDSMQKESRTNEAGVSVSAGYGPVSMTVSAKTQSTDSSETATRTSRNNTKETVSKAVERVQKRVRRQQTTTITTETTETNRHKFAAKDKSIVGVYRYVEKKYWCQILNYGARLMMEFVVPEPATYFLFSQAKGASASGAAKPDEPNIRPSDLDESNYAQYAKQYNATVTDPPAAFRYSDVYYLKKDNGGQQPLAIDTNFEAISCTATWAYSYTVGGAAPSVIAVIGDQAWRAPDSWPNVRGFSPPVRGGFSATAFGVNVTDFVIGIQLVLRRTQEAFQRWQLETYNAIMAAYQSAKEAYDRSLANQSANRPQIQLRSDAEYRSVESIELRRACLELLTDQHFDAFGAIQNVGGRPTIDNSAAREQGPVVEFFEQAFEWPQMTYTFYPYYWGRKSIWEDRLNLNDVDPIFGKFLRAGSARVVIPVRRNMENDLIYFLKHGDIWGNTHTGDAPLPDDPDYVPITQEIRETDEMMGRDSGDGIPEGAPWQVVIPTPLVCLDADGLDLPSWDLPVPGKAPPYVPSEATCHGVPYNAAQWPDAASMAAGLKQLGYTLPAAGDFRQYFGTPAGRRTVEAFQRKANEQGVSAVLGVPLRVDGVLGPCTLRALTAMTERFFRKEWPGPGVA